MNNKPNPELIDEDNPEWTAAMFNTAKTATELLPPLSNNNNGNYSAPFMKKPQAPSPKHEAKSCTLTSMKLRNR